MVWFKKGGKSAKGSGISDNEAKYEVLERIAVLTRMEKAGLLAVDMKERKVVISSVLASPFLSDRKKWTGFLNNVQAWFLYRTSQLSWEKRFRDAELSAVRKARAKYAALTRLQEMEIRSKAREKVEVTDVEPPEAEAYDFVLCNSLTDGREPEVFAVGRYEDGKFEMVTFETFSDKGI